MTGRFFRRDGSQSAHMLHLSMHTIVDPNLLTKEQLDLVRAAAAHRGKLAVQASARTGGRAVCAGREAFFDRQDRQVAKRYIEALHELISLQIFRSAGSRESYEFTNSGWQVSRKTT